MKFYFYTIAAALIIANTLKPVFAVPPPDFIFNIGAQIAQVFSVIVIFLSVLVATVRKYAKVYFIHMKSHYRKLIWIVVPLMVVGIGFAGAYFYQQQAQQKEYQQWITESEAASKDFELKDYEL